MKNPLEFSKENEDPQEEQINKLIAFSKNNDMSSEDVFIAYQLAMGLASEASDLKQPLRKEVYALAKTMAEYMNAGLAANRIVSLVETKKIYETVAGTYNKVVDNLLIPEDKKKELKSILAEKKSGVITITDEQTGEKIGKITIPKDVSRPDYKTNQMALELIAPLREYMDKKISINFDAD